MDNNKKTTKFLPQGHAPVVKKEQLLLHTFSDITDFCDAVSSIILNLFLLFTTKLRATGLTHFCRTVSDIATTLLTYKSKKKIPEGDNLPRESFSSIV
ncbi:hypothetical protein [Porphyromonas circumdentaria]|uniref:Uncharacterized protein n=1 Tax=Porphyromonas circumdentaria TaxID=29524 RepID=A0A1T4PYN0_9PORP|nr:hypothetical protein [Porphyromonas circumdentaria]MBB6276532.1 hypothetical protein [Porphyromonas circumdentaria]SJZ96549.1 hypothetical protein SAMN02745171_01643 [Porphyromonas circumdentaria]